MITGTPLICTPWSSRTKGVSFQYSTILGDSNQPVLRRFEPNSRSILISEQENPWNLLQLQDMLSRHRGDKLVRQCELSEQIILLSPGYFSFVYTILSIQ